MAFTNTRGRYASFGVMTSLPDDIIDSFWYVIDNYLKHVYPLNSVLKFELINRKGKTTLRFSQKDFPLEIAVDFLIPFDPYYPRQVRIVDNKGRETIMLIDEYQLLKKKKATRPFFRYKQNKKGQMTSFTFIGKTGFEPATPWSQTKYSTKLSYFPN